VTHEQLFVFRLCLWAAFLPLVFVFLFWCAEGWRSGLRLLSAFALVAAVVATVAYATWSAL
jgi:hypothetical protein